MIRDAVAYVRGLERRPWLVVGKGPSLDRYDELCRHLPAAYHVLTLGSACLAVEPAAALFMDLEACLKCWQKAPGLPYCLPWHPHVGYKPAEPTLAWYVTEGMAPSGALSFNSSTAGKLKRNPALATLRVRYFSSVAAFNLLGKAGVDSVYSIGLDGGTGYAAQFDPAACLANGQASFDPQFSEIGQTCREHGIDHYNLGRNRDPYGQPLARRSD